MYAAKVNGDTVPALLYQRQIDQMTIRAPMDGVVQAVNVAPGALINGGTTVATFFGIIDGTNGDTLLQPVTAQFLKTSLKATGGVENIPGQKGKTITLDAETNGRLEDILRLVLKSDQPPMTGAIRFHSKILLPPGEPEVVQRLRLDGRFVTDNAAFTKENLKERLKLRMNFDVFNVFNVQGLNAPGSDGTGIVTLQNSYGGFGLRPRQVQVSAQLVLARDEVPGLVLGGERETAQRMGWTTWIRSRGFDRDADETTFSL